MDGKQKTQPTANPDGDESGLRVNVNPDMESVRWCESERGREHQRERVVVGG